jgi:hypothetical protein
MNRIQQLVAEIGRPLLERAQAAIGAELALETYTLEDKWAAILQKLDELDPSVLLPLLKVPKRVMPHFEDALTKRLTLCHRRGGRPATPSYMPMPLSEATTRLAARFVHYLVTHGAPKDKTVELLALVYELPPNKLSDAIIPGKRSALRNLHARRANRPKRRD